MVSYVLHYVFSVVREIAMNDKNALNDGDEDSNTALHLAALGGHIRLVETLLDLGAGPEIRFMITIIVFYYELKIGNSREQSKK